MKEEDLKVLACKHAGSTSSIQQLADIGRQFAVMKAENKTAAVEIHFDYYVARVSGNTSFF